MIEVTGVKMRIEIHDRQIQRGGRLSELEGFELLRNLVSYYCERGKRKREITGESLVSSRTLIGSRGGRFWHTDEKLQMISSAASGGEAEGERRGKVRIGLVANST